MKKLLLILLALLPLITMSQNTITMKNGDKINCKLGGMNGSKLTIINSDKNAHDFQIDVSLINEISGEITAYRKKLILKINPEIKFSTYVPVESTTDNAALTTAKEYNPYNISQFQKVKTPGDYIKASAGLRLSAFALTSVTTVSILAGAFKDDLDTQKTVAIVSGVTSIALYIAGELLQIKAGKLMNEQITIAPASQGIGLAINF